MDLCPVCGAYWACDHGERVEPIPEPNYVDLDYVQYGETVHGYDLVRPPAPRETDERD